MVKIERGIKFPYKSTRNKYPWEEMKVGDSFVCTASGAWNTAAHASMRYAPKVFKTATTNGEVRVWRVA